MKPVYADTGAGKSPTRTATFGWASLGLSVLCLLVYCGILTSSPHENAVAADVGLLLCGLGFIVAGCGGILSLCRKERPKYPAILCVVAAVFVTIFFLLNLLIYFGGLRFEHGF